MTLDTRPPLAALAPHEDLMSKRHCPTCRSTNLDLDARHERTEAVGATPVRMSVSCVQCRACGSRIVAEYAIASARLAVAVQLAKRNVLSRESFRFVRTALGLQSKQLATILSVQPETVSRWERGHRDVDPTAWSFLRTLLEEHTSGRRPIGEVLRDASALPKASVSSDEIVVADHGGGSDSGREDRVNAVDRLGSVSDHPDGHASSGRFEDPRRAEGAEAAT